MIKTFFYMLSFTLLCSCAGDFDIFPDIPLDTDSSSIVLPSPISLAIDEVNSQIILVNSNVNFSYDGGSIAVINVDASDPTSPVLEATEIIATPNFAGSIIFNGSSAYIPFREQESEDSEDDQVGLFTVGDDTIEQTTLTTTGENPYGISFNGDGSQVLVVSNEELNIYDASLNNLETVDLTEATDADIDDAESEDVENIVVDAATNRAFISNRGGHILVVDLDSNTLTHVINGPDDTGGMATDGTYVYVVSGTPSSLWVLDPSQLSDPDSTPEEVDDSTLVVDVLDLGISPNNIALDTTNARAYITNTDEDDPTISVVDLNLFEEIDRISLDEDDTGLDDAEEPFGIAVGTFNGTTYVFVTNFESDNLAVIHAATLEVVAMYP